MQVLLPFIVIENEGEENGNFVEPVYREESVVFHSFILTVLKNLEGNTDLGLLKVDDVV